MYNDGPIGVIDSGIGGLTVLSAMMKRLPNENFIYLADTEHSPYGNKKHNEILTYTDNNIKCLLEIGCKAIVLACNTATAAAVEPMRKKYPQINIIGLEPALRPPVYDFPGMPVLVLATPLTLSEKRFEKLRSEFEITGEKIYYCVPAQEIVEYTEAEVKHSQRLITILREYFKPFEKIKFPACVLGCTHFPLAKSEISEALGYTPRYYDGGEGAAKRLEFLLARDGIGNGRGSRGTVLFTDTEFSAKAIKILSNYNNF